MLKKPIKVMDLSSDLKNPPLVPSNSYFESIPIYGISRSIISGHDRLDNMNRIQFRFFVERIGAGRYFDYILNLIEIPQPGSLEYTIATRVKFPKEIEKAHNKLALIYAGENFTHYRGLRKKNGNFRITDTLGVTYSVPLFPQMNILDLTARVIDMRSKIQKVLAFYLADEKLKRAIGESIEENPSYDTLVSNRSRPNYEIDKRLGIYGHSGTYWENATDQKPMPSTLRFQFSEEDTNNPSW